jgi:hypothetical protein
MEIGTLQFEASLGKKLGRSYLKNKLGMVMHTCGSSYLRSKGRRISGLNPGQKCKTLS